VLARLPLLLCVTHAFSFNKRQKLPRRYGHEKIKTRILTLYLFTRIGDTKIETLHCARPGKRFLAGLFVTLTAG
jgi:hypothetical protein